MATPTQLLIEGPSEVALSEDAVFTGSLKADAVPVPDKKLMVSVDGVPIAYPVTDADGKFSFSHRFSSEGPHPVTID